VNNNDSPQNEGGHMIKTFTLVLGVILLAAGIVGFITGGHDHKLIIFGINASHNMVHILSGVLAIVAVCVSMKAAKIYCIAFGAVYGLVTIAGFLNIPQAVNLLNLNTADNFLHLGISGACLYFGLTSKV
jgi:hypothetical protein